MRIVSRKNIFENCIVVEVLNGSELVANSKSIYISALNFFLHHSAQRSLLHINRKDKFVVHSNKGISLVSTGDGLVNKPPPLLHTLFRLFRKRNGVLQN